MKQILKGEKLKKYACFTPEQQKTFDSLTPLQRRYVLYRGKGYKKAESYRMAGFGGKQQNVASYVLERNHPEFTELINAFMSVKKVKELSEEESELNQRIDALATQDTAEKMLEKIDGADGETAQRIKFYRDIVNGKIKSQKKITRKNAEGVVIETRLEEYNDVDTRLRARKELDKILGLNDVIDLSSLQMGDITINIVDASKRDAIEDKSNQVVLEDYNVTAETEEKVGDTDGQTKED